MPLFGIVTVPLVGMVAAPIILFAQRKADREAGARLGSTDRDLGIKLPRESGNHAHAEAFA
jgi:hypothetical protein